MFKNKRNNKGFTLIEVIIAISIFSVVIVMGYKIINGSNKVSTTQSEISKEQQNANLVNKYITKDLEVVKKIESFGIDNEGKLINNKSAVIKYGYNIETSNNNLNKIIKYEVNVNQSNEEYSIIRYENSESIDIVSNQKYDRTKSELPLVISKEEELYYMNVLIGSNKYNFKINSRIKTEDTNTTTPPGGGGENLNATGNIVIDKTQNSLDVTISDTVIKDKYKPRIAVKKYDSQRKVYLYIDDNREKYEFEFIENGLKIKNNNNTIDFDKNDTKELNNESFSVKFYSTGRDIKIYKNSKEIIAIDTNGNYKSEIGFFDNTKDEVDIEIEGDEVELDFGDDFNKVSTDKSSTKEIEVELSKHLVKDVKAIDIKAINTEINLEGDGKGYLSEILGLNPSDYYDEDEVELDMDTKEMKEGSSVIINFISDIDKEISGDGIKLQYYQKSNKAVEVEIIDGNQGHILDGIYPVRPSNDTTHYLEIIFQNDYAIAIFNSSENVRPIKVKINSKSIVSGIIKNLDIIQGYQDGDIKVELKDGRIVNSVNNIKIDNIKSIKFLNLKFNNGHNMLQIKWN